MCFEDLSFIIIEMIFYRLIVKRLIVYFELDRLSEQQEKLKLLLKKKDKEAYKTKLNTDPTLNLYISILLSIVVFLIFVSIPFHAMDAPCEVLKNGGYHISYEIALVIEQYTDVIDYFIIVFFIMLVYATIKTVADAIAHTDISKSPWLEQGKYTLPPKRKRSFIIKIKK